MGLDHSSHVNDAHILEIASGAVAVSACSSRLGRRWIGFRLRGSTLVWIILRSPSRNRLKQATASLYQTSLTPTFLLHPWLRVPPARARSGDRSTSHARPPVFDHMAERNLRHRNGSGPKSGRSRLASKQDSRRYRWRCVTTYGPTRFDGHSRVGPLRDAVPISRAGVLNWAGPGVA